ncbi:peptidoglycan-associated lipoprotein [Microbulbifer aestuariivivens]|uniref:Peptidoglycan-associated lipoprotein n=1 Tax=Microbulbifer aestuariivivens TaxID=1908308 RepID=A0ABP9WPF2_9GAMM
MLASQLTESRSELENLAYQLDTAHLSANDANQLAIDSLQFQLFFITGDDQLADSQLRQVTTLAEFLQRYPQLQVCLEGHADPRGSDGYNNVLSDQRALSVQRVLIASGVDSARIQRKALGATLSQAPQGDIDAYAMERRVDIHIAQP